MRSMRVFVIGAVLALAACGGGSEEADVGDPPPTSPAPPTPPAPSPPSPPPPPPPGNGSPVADAGEDKGTVEEQDVTIDGSRTRDPDNDPLTYAWELRSAPAGSRLSVGASSATFVFRPDVPGTYDLQLTASDGRTSDTDTMRVRAEALLAFTGGGEFKVERGDDDDEKHRRPLELRARTSSLYRGAAVAFTAATDAAWLRVLEPGGTTAPSGDTTKVAVALVMNEVDRLPNGDHEAHVIVTPSGGWERAVVAVKLELKGRGRDEIAPYVAYTEQPSVVTVYGTELLAAAGESVFVGEVEVAKLSAVSDTQATIALPPLTAGVHSLRIGRDSEAARLVVRDFPMHRVTQLPVPGLAQSVEYDPERDAFYAVFVTTSGARTAQRLQNTGTGVWVVDAIPVDAPREVALTADGADLLVSSDGCTLHRLDPHTLSVRESSTTDACSADGMKFGAIAMLVDGKVAAVDDSADPTLWQYPADSRTFVPLPNTATFEFTDGTLYVRELR